jgi:riboflavin kinase / FMN adenylyltransferase
MKIFKVSETPLFSNASVTVGTFDGVHCGHRKVLQRLTEISKETGGDSVVFTFWPHPRIVLGKNDVKLLNTLEEKLHVIEKVGVDAVVLAEFNSDFSRITSYDFVKNYLIDRCRAKNIIVGHDHHFGKMREGKYETLGNLSKEFNFKLYQVVAESVGSHTVSSTKIRRELEAGNISIANAMLGYPYLFSGKVVEGFRIGKNIGFPTANIGQFEPYKQIPGNGVYAVTVQVFGKTYKGMMNIGVRPTIVKGSHVCSIEVHLFEFNKDIYGENITIRVHERIRDEVKFDSLNDLKKQLGCDREIVLKALEK